MTKPSRKGQRRPLASRAIAAIGGGYLLACGWAVALSMLWPVGADGGRSAGVVAGTASAFAVYVAVAIWAFAAPNALRAWLGILGPAAGLALLAAWSAG